MDSVLVTDCGIQIHSSECAAIRWEFALWRAIDGTNSQLKSQLLASGRSSVLRRTATAVVKRAYALFNRQRQIPLHIFHS